MYSVPGPARVLDGRLAFCHPNKIPCDSHAGFNQTYVRAALLAEHPVTRVTLDSAVDLRVARWDDWVRSLGSNCSPHEPRKTAGHPASFWPASTVWQACLAIDLPFEPNERGKTRIVRALLANAL